MRSKSLYNFGFSLFLFFFLNISFSQLKISKTPNWVDYQTYEKNQEIALNEISYGLLTLLSDEQIHIPNQERYIRMVRKITDNVGVQDGSQISINYDPTYQKLTLHEILIIRDGKAINRFNLNDFQTIRQESNSENYIYDGSLNAVANLADIRNGDIVDVSYTVKGFNPIYGSHFSGGTTLNDYQPVGKINYYLISKEDLSHKILNLDIKPVIKIKNGFKTYRWTNTLTVAPKFESNTPMWHLPYQNIFVSNFKSWNEVVNWAESIYTDNSNLSEALKTKIDQIHDKYDNEGERISATLKFVQNEIRYLGLESGIGAYKPFSPNKVLNQRFGDCKDKSWLMVTMLQEMNIDAYPVYINSVYGESLDKFLPSPKVFDHVVVKVIDSLQEEFYYDPTSSNQFGDYKSVSFPNYGKGLVIKPETNSLDIIKNKSEDLIEVFDTYDLPTVGGPGELNIMTVYREAEADLMRARYKSTSINNLKEQFKSYYDNLYDGVEVLKDPIIDDDSLQNKIWVTESYKINDIWKPMVGMENNLAVEFAPYSILDVFMSPAEKDRETPFALYYPTHKKHQITVKLPRNWSSGTDKLDINSKNFDFSLRSKMNSRNDILYINYEYENKTSFVRPEDFEDYYNKCKELEQKIAYYIYIPKTGNLSTNASKPFDAEEVASSFVTFLYWILGIALVIVLGLVIYAVRNTREKT
ncbi:MAG: DUF3857 domain-containing transglutaminase family protein [Bacteroidota bacterium]